MSYLDDLWDSILGTGERAGEQIVDSGIDALLGSIGITGPGGLGITKTGKAEQLLEQLYKDAKGGAGLTPYTNTPLKPNLVNYTGIGAPTTVGTPTYTPGTLNYSQIPELEKLTQQGYTPAQIQAVLAGEMQGYDTTKVNAQKLNPEDLAKFDPSMMDPTVLGELATYDPETFEAIMLGDPSVIEDNPELKAKLYGNLSKYEKQSEQGFDGIDQMSNNQMLQDQAKQSSRQQAAIIDNLKARNVAGGGQELMARMMADQAASEAGQKGGLELLKEQRARKDAGLAGATNLANSLRSTELDMSAKNAAMVNDFTKTNAGFANDAAKFNAGQVTAANKYAADASNERDITNANFAQDAAKSNQAATNTANQWNAGQTNNALVQNGQWAQDADKTNAASANEAAKFLANTNNNRDLANVDIQNKTNATNAGYMNDANKYTADANNAATKYNVGAANTRLADNTKISNDSALANFNAQNTAGQFNINNQLSTDKYNVTNQIDTNKYNTNNSNQMSRDNAGILNDVDKSNRDFTFNTQKQTNADKLNQFGTQISAGNNLAKQYNGAEAAAAQNQYAQNMGGGNKSTGENFWDKVIDVGGDVLGSWLGVGQGGGGGGGTTIDWTDGTSYTNNPGAIQWTDGSSYMPSSGGGNWWDNWFADGGTAPMGEPSVVGERGPEVIVPTQYGTQVFPNSPETQEFIDEMMTFGGSQEDKKTEKGKNYYFPPKFQF